jgi:tRNA pseudouridine38-40 synthase
MKYALKFGYDGKNYSGYARQPNLRTIEGEIILALLRAKIIEDPSHFGLEVASRTDKGVSALGNVVSFFTDFREAEMISALNAHLDDIWFYGLAKVHDDFNPRHAKSRWYRYHIYADDLDFNSVKRTAEFFVGKHNFRNFAKLEGNEPFLTIDSIDVSKEENVVVLDIRAQRFLWHMVRRMVEAILDVEAGKISRDDIEHALKSQEKVDFGVAPPEPLILMDVEYDFDFEIDSIRMRNLSDKLTKELHTLHLTSTIYKQLRNIVKDKL